METGDSKMETGDSKMEKGVSKMETGDSKMEMTVDSKMEIWNEKETDYSKMTKGQII